ncbi:uncharacterized protein DUF490 [Pontibacter ummariensis]|uniref:Uncharacterized protein n=1 Tax=Pontibacter ummariensis TaxID=1610492 RepID=A0A239J631_9BACT|nr:uncharacterized protein DUF490 [Pontibacter ummariensis]SNT01285.1 Family of unknown function [Pontibacter ummariensis]
MQNYLAQQGADYLEDTLGTKVDIGGFTTDFGNTWVLQDVYVEDQQQDTLWYSQRLGADLDILALLSGNLDLGDISLQKATVKLHIREDGSTNYDFIMEAFAPTDTAATQPADTSAAMQISIDEVRLDDVYLVFRDEAGGNFVRTRIGELYTSMDEINLDEQRYLVDEIELSNTWAYYEQTKLPPESEDAPQPLELDFGLNRVALEDILLTYISRPAGQRAELKLGESELVAHDINLEEARIDLKSFALHNTSVLYAMDGEVPNDSTEAPPEEPDEIVNDPNAVPMDWLVTLGELDVTYLDVDFEVLGAPEQPQGMNYNDLLFTDVVVDAENILYSLNRFHVDLNQLTLQEQSGFEIENFQALIEVDTTSASLRNLDLRTNNSLIQSDLAITYPSLEAITERPSLVGVRADINNTVIGLQDIQYLLPDIAADPAFKSIVNSEVKVEAEVTGTLDNLRLQDLQVAGLKNTYVDVSGTIRNAMDPENLYLDLDIDRFATTRTDVQALLPAGTIPEGFRLPNQISLEGNYTGSLTSFDVNTQLKSSFGNIDVDIDTGPNERFTATVSSTGFDLGQVIEDSLGLGEIAFAAKATGTGLTTPAEMVANVDAEIIIFEYNNYTYNDIDIEAEINRSLYQVSAVAEDENLAFALTGEFNMRDTLQPAYAFNLALKEANLHALNFYPDTLAVEGQLEGRFTGVDPAKLSGVLTAEQLVIRTAEEVFPIDTLVMALEQTGEIAELDVRSDVLDGQVRFENTLATLPVALQKYFSTYFDLQPDPPYPAGVNLEDFTFALNPKQTRILTAFVPGLQQLQSGPITGAYNSETQEFEMYGRIPLIEYTDYVMRGLGLQVTGDENSLSYDVTLDAFVTPDFTVDHIGLEGAARDDSLAVRLAIAGDSVLNDDKLVLGGVLTSEGRGFRFSFDPDAVVINGDDWDVPPGNYLLFGSDLLYANNVVLSHGASAIALNSTGPVTANAPLHVAFDNVDIAYMLSTFQEPQDTSLIAGTINGEATLRDILTGSPVFTSDLQVEDFIYDGSMVGDLAVEASSAPGNRYNVDALLTDNGNEVVIDGFLEAQPNATLLNLRANIDRLNLASLQGFTAGMVEAMDGAAEGDLRITGTLDNPDIIGELNFDQAQFAITMLGSLYRVDDEQLVFNEAGILFPNFVLTDTLNNELVVEGRMLTQDYTDFQFDLTVETDRFLALSSTAADNDLYYGDVLVAADAAISGTLALPVVRAEVRVLDGSEFTAVVPADEVAAAEREGVVEFVNLNESLTGIVGTGYEEDSVEVEGFVGADVEVELYVTDATPISIVIDPITGDNLVVRGTADPLFIGMRPSGEINMTGRYEVSEGSYSMDFYDLVSRELAIADGSYITWTGDPLQADMNITAVYTVEAAPRELVASQAVGTDNPALRNQYTFLVYVNVEGDILQPQINFEIELPEEERGNVPAQVTASLAALEEDVAELNKQVFSLLVLGRFMAPDPLQSSGGGFEGTARNSLSGLLTDQLNQLTQQYAGGLGLELGVDSYQDFSSGSAEGRTDLNVALRQQFLDDRLTVRVGTDIGLEGQSQQNRNVSGFGGDISVEYSLTEDGRLRVQAFQRNQFQDFLEGDVRATGAALIYQREYNNFSDLFRSLENRRRKEKLRREEEIMTTETR